MLQTFWTSFVHVPRLSKVRETFEKSFPSVPYNTSLKNIMQSKTLKNLNFIVTLERVDTVGCSGLLITEYSVRLHGME